MGTALGDLFEPGSISGVDILLALITILVGWIASSLARKGVLALMDRLVGFSVGTKQLVGRIVKYGVLLVAIGVALGFLGASVQPLLAMALIVGVVLALTLRGISNNFAAGVLLQTRQPVHLGDEIQCDDYVGTIQEMNGRSVVIRTRDGRSVHIPNSYLLDNPLVNHSTPGARRSEVEVRVAGFHGEVDPMIDDLVAAVVAVPAVLSDPPVRALVILVADDRATLHLRFWHDPLTAPSTTSDVVRAVSASMRIRELRCTVTSDLPPAPLTTPPGV